MATVWVARQTGKHGFEKLVAVKTILPKFASDPAFQKMFREEARIASRIEHANATQILDVGEQQEMTYLVMEYVDGDALLGRLPDAGGSTTSRCPRRRALRVLADACRRAASRAHRACATRTGRSSTSCTRDRSAENLLVSTKGVAKIIDFGIAKAATVAIRNRT